MYAEVVCYCDWTYSPCESHIGLTLIVMYYYTSAHGCGRRYYILLLICVQYGPEGGTNHRIKAEFMCSTNNVNAVEMCPKVVFSDYCFGVCRRCVLHKRLVRTPNRSRFPYTVDTLCRYLQDECKEINLKWKPERVLLGS